MTRDESRDNERGSDRPSQPQSKKDKAKSKDNRKDYDIGYGKPPAHSQFKKGVSGNPKGRPKEPTTFLESFNKELSLDVKVVTGNRNSKITGLSAVTKTYKNKLISGDFRYMKLFMDKNAKDVDIGPYICPEQKNEPEIDSCPDLRAPLELPTSPRRAAYIEVQNIIREVISQKLADGETTDDNNLR
jgi:hypothetical protein